MSRFDENQQAIANCSLAKERLEKLFDKITAFVELGPLSTMPCCYRLWYL